jgi:hypothetical protein
MSEVTAIITAATALAAVILGPIISIYVARRQIRASVVSTNRQVWINALRDAIAEWLTAEQVFYISKHTDFWQKADAQKALENLALLEYRIRLLINPEEDDHAKLVELLRKESDDLMKSLESARDQYDKQQAYGDDEIISLAQSILKREWERVKQGD